MCNYFPVLHQLNMARYLPRPQGCSLGSAPWNSGGLFCSKWSCWHICEELLFTFFFFFTLLCNIIHNLQNVVALSTSSNGTSGFLFIIQRSFELGWWTLYRWWSIEFYSWNLYNSINQTKKQKQLLWFLHFGRRFSHCGFTSSPIFLTNLWTTFAKKCFPYPSTSKSVCEVLETLSLSALLGHTASLWRRTGREGGHPGCGTSAWLDQDWNVTCYDMFANSGRTFGPGNWFRAHSGEREPEMVWPSSHLLCLSREETSFGWSRPPWASGPSVLPGWGSMRRTAQRSQGSLLCVYQRV